MEVRYTVVAWHLPAIALLALGCGVGNLTAQAADPIEDSNALKAASAHVAEAFQAEIEGDFLTRQCMLTEAENVFPEFAPARWQRGQLHSPSGEWIDIEDSVEAASKDQRLVAYERRRAGLTDQVNSHFAMANWCLEQGLLDQCRSHLNKVLEFNPDDLRARNALGYVLVGSEWYSPQQLAEIAARGELASQSVEQYASKLRPVMVSLSDVRTRSAGREALMEIKEPEAVFAVEAAFATANTDLAPIAIDWFASIDSVEASHVLARYSLMHPADEIRQRASLALKQRPLHDFVPDMLSMLSAPVSVSIVPEFDRRGRLTGYSQAFAQEKYDRVDYVVLERAFERQAVTLNTGVDFNINLLQRRQANLIQNSLIDMTVRELAANEARSRGQLALRENEEIARRNARISDVLSEVAEREFSSDPKQIWEWWDDYNETQYQAYKPERYRRNRLNEIIPEYQQPTCECFVAGTLVMTVRGLWPIEQIVVGDSVLSRNVASGELCWKPVLRATTRPPSKTSTISIGDETFRSTTGHLYWVSGRGWQKASALKAGDILHAAREPMVVTRNEESDVEATYNLQVADHANYFVGKNLVLTHDVTPRAPTRILVPGQTGSLALAPPQDDAQEKK
ncbi:MAG: polymorphic toxin-type HINT domain-containing protein [Pirellulaceae bacterium]